VKLHFAVCSRKAKYGHRLGYTDRDQAPAWKVGNGLPFSMDWGKTKDHSEGCEKKEERGEITNP